MDKDKGLGKHQGPELASHDLRLLQDLHLDLDLLDLLVVELCHHCLDRAL